jgi:hypothetical protein
VKIMLAAGLVTAVIVTACASARETETPEVLSPGRGAPGDTTIVGRVTSEGRVVADTLTDRDPDPARVERETVFAGVITPSEETTVAGRGPWRVQLYAARDRAAADSVAASLRGTLAEPIRVDEVGGWYQVRAGAYSSRAAAEPLRRLLASRGWRDAFIVRAR